MAGTSFISVGVRTAIRKKDNATTKKLKQSKKLKEEQNLSIVNSGTSADVRRFWYFNDLDGDDVYEVGINNGTAQTTIDWIRNNIPSNISR